MLAQNKDLIFQHCCSILGLNYNTSMLDIKKTYRLLAKKNHPDKFKNEDDKLRQSKIMANITEAYKFLIENYNEVNNHNKSRIKENDYDIYKTGLNYFNKYSDTFFKLFSKRELITPTEKRECLIKAKSYFNKLIGDFPESIWIFDAREKLIKIENILKVL
jgi:DnaJ-class molecular chaperone